MPAPKGHEPYKGCETGGRPKKYTTEFIENEAEEFIKWMKQKNSLWYKDFALERGYDPNLLTLWSKENEKFSGAYIKAKEWQASLLVRGGLLNKFNANITKFVLTNACGWSERTETKISGDAANPLSFILQEVDGITKELVDEEE